MKREDAEFIYEELKARMEQDMPKEDILDIMCSYIEENKVV